MKEKTMQQYIIGVNPGFNATGLALYNCSKNLFVDVKVIRIKTKKLIDNFNKQALVYDDFVSARSAANIIHIQDEGTLSLNQSFLCGAFIRKNSELVSTSQLINYDIINQHPYFDSLLNYARVRERDMQNVYTAASLVLNKLEKEGNYEDKDR